MKNITEIEIKSRIIVNHDIIFNNEEFPNQIIIDLKNAYYPILELGNVKAYSLLIINGEIQQLTIFKNSKIESLQIRNVKINNTSILNCEISNTFKFENCQVGKLTCIRLLTKEHWLAFHSCPQIGDLDFQETNITLGIQIEDCLNVGFIRLYEMISPEGSLIISRSKLNGKIMIVAGTILKRIILNQSEFYDNFKIESSIINNGISIIENTFNKSFSISLKSKNFGDLNEVQFSKEIYLEKNAFKGGFEVVGDETTDFIINSLHLNLNNQMLGNIVFRKLWLNKVLITGTNTITEIIINNIITSEIIIENLENYGKFTLSNIRGKDYSKFHIVSSNLENTILNDIDFNQFDLRIIKSTCNKMNYSNITWPNNIKVSLAENIIPSSEEYKRRQNLFRQLKQTAKQNENKMDELKFLRLEWNATRKQENADGKSLHNKLNDWFILQSNRTNNYGTNWILPIIFLLLFNFIFFVIQVVILCPNLSFITSFANFNSSFLIDEIQKNSFMFWHFLNPTHNLQHIDRILLKNNYSEINSNSLALFWNYLMRIFTGYFIYQTIVAFRKFSR